MAVQFQTVQVDDQTLNRIQSNVASAFNSVSGPFIGGVLLSNVTLVAGSTTQVNHGLSRIPQLFVVCDLNVNTAIWRSSWDANSLYLNCGTNCIVSLWVN